MALYTYQKVIRSDKLLLEIEYTLSITLDGTDGSIVTNGNAVLITTVIALDSTDEATLDGIVAAHTTIFPPGDFDSILFFEHFAAEFDTIERTELAQDAPNFVTELMFYNFHEIKEIRDFLLTAQKITQAQADRFTALFAEQDIDLDTF